jgi:quercetin dioxygenase-like cupin family protein
MGIQIIQAIPSPIMAIPHASSGQPIDISPLGTELKNAKTYALFKTEQMEVIRLVLPAGKSFPPHQVPGDITIQCMEGLIEVTAGDSTHKISTGQLMYVSGSVLHGLLGLEDATVLITIAMQR